MLVTSKTSKVNRVAPWLRITFFFSIFPPIKILHRKIRDVKGCNMVYRFACTIFRVLNTKPSKTR